MSRHNIAHERIWYIISYKLYKSYQNLAEQGINNWFVIDIIINWDCCLTRIEQTSPKIINIRNG